MNQNYQNNPGGYQHQPAPMPQQPYPMQENGSQFPYPPQPLTPMQPQQPLSQQPFAPTGNVPPLQPQAYPYQSGAVQPVQPLVQQPYQQTGAAQPISQTQPYVPQPPAGYESSERTGFFSTALNWVLDHRVGLLLIAALLGLCYALFVTFSFGSLAQLRPHMIVIWLGIVVNFAGMALHNRWSSLAGAAAYVVAMLLFLNYFYLLIPSAALCALDYWQRKSEQ